MTKKRKNNKIVKIQMVVLIIFSLIFLIMSLSLILYVNSINNSHFQIKDRFDNIKKANRNDEDSYKTIGWLRVQGTNIDMPVIAVLDYEEGPSISRDNYSWTRNSNGKYYNSMRIYGHNIFNLSAKPKIKSSTFKRFEELMAFVYPEVAEKNQYVQLAMNNKNYVYQIYAVSMVDYYKLDPFPKGNHTKKQMNNYINLLKENSIYNYNIKVDENDNILSLVTCTRMFGTDADIAVVISAKLVDNYNRLNEVTKNENYKELEKIMKGADVDEDISA